MGELYPLDLPPSRATALKLRIDNDDYSAFMEHGLPIPSGMAYGQHFYYVAWLLHGYMGTLIAREAYNALADKIAYLLGGHATADLFAPQRGSGRIYHMRDFPYLEKPKTIYTGEREIYHNGKDLLFDQARHRIYGAQRAGVLTEAKAFDIVYTANIELGGKKCPADIRSKARNMYEWTTKHIEKGGTEGGYAVWSKAQRAAYMRDYNQRKVYEMSRADAAKKAREALVSEKKAKVIGAVESMKFLQEKITVSGVARYAGVSRNTAKKYLKELGLI
jgi:hypothetical protein